MKNDLNIVHVIGYSNSYKTTLIKEIICELKNNNKSVATLKSAKGHNFLDPSKKKKDSEIFFEEGADLSITAFKDAIEFVSKELDIEQLIKVLELLQIFDVMIIEGFKSKNLSEKKILCWSNELETNECNINMQGVKYLFCHKNLYSDVKEKVEKFTIKHSLKVYISTKDLLTELFK